MANVQFNKADAPLIGYGTRGVFLSTMDAPEEKPKKLSIPQQADPDKTSIEGVNVADWGTS